MRVGVVGAGITGLATTHYLAERGVDVTAFEADDQPGGVIRSGRVDGRVLEYGPQRVRLTPAIEALVGDLGIRGELLVADDDAPLYVYADGRLREVPRSVRSFLRTDLLSWRGKLRLLAEPLTGAIDPDERAATAFRRKFGREAYRNVIEPLFGGIYGSDPADMPAEQSLSRLMALEERKGSLLRAAAERFVRGGESPPPVSFEDGLQTLPEALYDRHRDRVRLDTPVDAIRQAEEGGYVLDADGQETEVDAVVVTVPAPEAAELLADVDGATAQPLRRLTYNSLVMVYLRAGIAPEGFGYQVRRDEPLRTIGVTWNAGLFGRDGVYTAFLGSTHDPEALDLSDEELGSIARREFGDVMGVDASVLEVSRVPRAFPAYDTSWAALDEVSVPDDVFLATNYTAAVGVPGRFRQAKQVAAEIAERA